MTLADPIGDMLTRIRNGQMRSLNKIEIPFSNFRSKILEVLKKEGYIINYKINENKNKIKFILVDLKYFEGLEKLGIFYLDQNKLKSTE